MHNKVYDDITILTKFFITIFIFLMFIFTKSIYINLFVILFILYLIILNDFRLNKYLKLLKNYLILDLLIFIILLLFIKFSFILIFKYVFIVLLISLFVLELNFEKTNTLIYKLIRNKYVSYRITLYLYYFNSIFSSKDEIRAFQKERGIKKYGFKYRFLARFEYAKYKCQKLDNNYKTSFYDIQKEKTNILSLVMFIIFAVLLIIVIIRK